MKKFNFDNILPGDILAVRSYMTFGDTIRVILGSYTNHDGMFCRKDCKWFVGEAIAPKSRLTDPRDYEDMVEQGIREIRILRIKKINDHQRDAIGKYFVVHKIGLKYPLSVLRLWVMRFVNSLPWKVKGEWCTRIVWEAADYIVPGCLDRPDGKKKKNPTPRTIENRLVAGILEDVTDSCFVESD